MPTASSIGRGPVTAAPKTRRVTTHAAKTFIKSIFEIMLFIKLFRLLDFEQAVEVFADGCQVKKPAAMDIPSKAEMHRFHFPFRHEVVEGATLDSEQAFHIPPAPEFWEHL